MIFIHKDGTREKRPVKEMTYLIEVNRILTAQTPPMTYKVFLPSQEVPSRGYPACERQAFRLHKVAANHFVYLEIGASLDLLKGEPRV